MNHVIYLDTLFFNQLTLLIKFNCLQQYHFTAADLQPDIQNSFLSLLLRYLFTSRKQVEN